MKRYQVVAGVFVEWVIAGDQPDHLIAAQRGEEDPPEDPGAAHGLAGEDIPAAVTPPTRRVAPWRCGSSPR